MKKKKSDINYILIFGVCVIILLAGIIIVQSVRDPENLNLMNSPTPSFPQSSTPVPTETETITASPAPTGIPTQTPTPTPTPTPLPIIDKIDESKLTGLDNRVREWYFENVSQSIVNLIEKQDGIYKKNSDRKVIYLTIDEGYEYGHTAKILDTLKEKNVKAIFFLTYSYVVNEPELVKRMVEEGHLIGNHTKAHESMPKKSVSDFIAELVSVERKVEELLGPGTRMFYYRPPAGAYSERDLNIAKQMGYKTVFWSFAYRDWETNNQKGEDFAHDTVIGNLHDGMVLLLHAVSKDNANALGRIIDSARAKGYEFRRIDE